MPTLLNWKEQLGNIFSFNGIDIKVIEVKAGLEENSKHFDTKVFCFCSKVPELLFILIILHRI